MSRQTRRQFLKQTALLTASLSTRPAAPPAAAAQNERSPNILFLMCDQLTPSVLSCYGGPVPTPNIDRLAARGVRFTNATCTTPYCSPSRASLVTGMYPHAHGIVLNCAPNRQRGITVDDITTEQLFGAAGYHTHHYGKWHLEDRAPLPYYRDMYRSAPEYTKEMQPLFEKARKKEPARCMNWYNWTLPVDIDPRFQRAVDALGDQWSRERFAEFITKMGRLKFDLAQCLDVRVARRTQDKLRQIASSRLPFMLTCSFVWPHDPNVVPSPYYEMFDPDKIALPSNRHVREQLFEKDWSRRIISGLGERGMREFLRIYYATVKLIDDQIGRILNTLERTGSLDDTIIIFTADHGDMAGGHGMVWKSTRAFYEEVVRIPLILHLPRTLEPAVCDIPTDSTDIMPTLLQLAGQPIPDQVQGQSVVPFLTGAKPLSQARKYTFSERVRPNPTGARKVLPGTKAAFMIRSKTHKLIRYENAAQYLYDLNTDPGETKNQIDNPKYAPIRAELSRQLNLWLARTNWPTKT